MDNLHWQLSVLSRAIHYKNLSGAAEHVGLSQPQLSRIISRIEGELDVVLLDRSVRRKSGWTPIAFKIAEIYLQSSRKLSASLQQLNDEDQISQLNVGCLEGMLELAAEFCQQLFDHSVIQTFELDVYDLSDLETRFEKNELDMIFTFREPGKQKYKYVRSLGYQTFKRHESKSTTTRVMSPFEFSHFVNRKKMGKEARFILSNSLAVRKLWVEKYGGIADFPSLVYSKKTDAPDETPVHLIANEFMSARLWDKMKTFKY